MTYKEAIDFLFSKLPMYQRVGKSAYKKDLSNTIALLNFLDNPHHKFKSVHIAGTNGKGTCAHGIASILQLSGYKTGLYTSPHLKSFTERIRINGKEVDQRFVSLFVNRIKEQIDIIQPSFFEITVAMAFEYFAQMKVDIAVIETGLGGRLDSTNVIQPEACLITQIGFDHMDLLGNTLTKIATEKAGIIKPNTPIVIGEYHQETFPVFLKQSKKLKSKLYLCHNYSKDLNQDKSYVKELNEDKIKLLIHSLKDIGWKIPQKNIALGIEQMEQISGLKGRRQVLSNDPTIIADVSHNIPGLTALFESLKKNIIKGDLYLIFGTVRDKNIKSLLELLPSQSKITWTQSNVPRALPAEELKKEADFLGINGKINTDVNNALEEVRLDAKPSDTILITGSTFVVAELDDL